MPLSPGVVLEDANGYLLFVVSVNESEVICYDDPIQTTYPCFRVERSFALVPQLEEMFFVRDPRPDEADRFRRAFGDLPTPEPAPQPAPEPQEPEPTETFSRFDREDPCPE